MADVLLINPPNRMDEYSTGKEMVPLGLLSVAALVEKAGHDVAVLDLEFEDQDVGQTIAREKPSVVGIAGTSATRFEAFELAQTAKKINPHIVTVYGGCHASFTAQDTLDHVPAFDVVVRGEGEETMVEILAALQSKSDLGGILGLSYRQNGKVVHNESRPRIKDLDLLPFPARHLVDMSGYHLKLDLINKKAASIITSRGCPINCSFCSASFMFGKTLTRRSAKNVVDEMEHVLDRYAVGGFKIFDSTFTLIPKHAEDICDEILRRGLEFPWECEIRASNITFALLQKMKKAGCYLVDFGIESANEKVLQRMNKGITMMQVKKVLDWTNQLGINQKPFFTFGHIEESMGDAQETLDFIKENLGRMAMPSIGVGIRVYPGTEVERFALSHNLLPGFSWSQPYHEERNKFLNTSTNIPILIQPQMGFDELLSIKQKTLAVQSSNIWFVLRRISKAHSWADLKKYAQFFAKMVRLKLLHKK
jgi:anaerobic magnesium-protoporphyrin IX monomethyl ester cyclase